MYYGLLCDMVSYAMETPLFHEQILEYFSTTLLDIRECHKLEHLSTMEGRNRDFKHSFDQPLQSMALSDNVNFL